MRLVTGGEVRELLSGQPPVPAGRWDRRVVLSETTDGMPLAIPLIQVACSEPGPRIWIQAGLHGDEIHAVVAAHQVLEDISRLMIRGSLVVVPVVNIPAFRASARSSPIDGIDGNRIWGEAGADPFGQRSHSAEFLDAYKGLVRTFTPDLVVDLHDGGTDYMVAEHSFYIKSGGPAAVNSEKAARAAGLPFLVAAAGVSGRTFDHWLRRVGIPSMTLEAGGTKGRIDSAVTGLRLAILRTLASLGAIAPHSEGALEKQSEVTEGTWLRSSRAGLLEAKVRLRERVTKGQVVGEVFDVFGRCVEVVKSPTDGSVFVLRTSVGVEVGDQVAKIVQFVS